jgi:SpoVK/Ycf46/Vps4 family AAA+-type ATPase
MTELAKKASQQRRMTLDNRALRRELSDGKAVMKKLIGSSPEMERLREDILDLGQADSHVLIDGETGTGKTLVAHALHAVGPQGHQEVHHAVVLRVGRGSSLAKSFSAPIRARRCPWWRRRAAARCVSRISRRCPTRCRRGF